MITRKVPVDFVFTAEELAEEFWGMHAGQQARFFNHLGGLDRVQFVTQLEFVRQSTGIHVADERLTDDGRAAMVTIGEYGTWPE